MAAVAIAKPKKKHRTDRVEPCEDTASEASIPSTSQKTSRPNSGKYAYQFFVADLLITFIRKAYFIH